VSYIALESSLPAPAGFPKVFAFNVNLFWVRGCADEVALLHERVLPGGAVHLFYETTGGPASYFTHAQGQADCSAADDLLHGLGAPDRTVVYFAVDIDVEPSSVTEYANGIESVQTPQITPGLYGYQRLCEFAKVNFPNLGKHLAQTYGTPTVPLELWQHLQEDRCGSSVDVNEAFVGGWKPQGGIVAIDPTELHDALNAPDPDYYNTVTAIKNALVAAHDALTALAAKDEALIATSMTKVGVALDQAALLIEASRASR